MATTVSEPKSPEIPPTEEGKLSTAATLRAMFSKNLRQSGMFIALALIFLLFGVLTDGIIMTPQNITNMIVQNSYILILAIGMVIIIIGGHIDLSVGSVAAFVGAVAGVMAVQWGWPWWLAVIGSLVVGALVGAWQGFWVAFVGIPAFIVTLAGMLIFRGAAMVTLGNAQISPFPGEFRAMASGYVPPLLGGQGFDALTLFLGAFAVLGAVAGAWRTRRARLAYHQEVDSMAIFAVKQILLAAVVMAFAWSLAQYKGLPVVLIILAALVLIYSAVMRRSVIGRHIYAMGGNLNAAVLSGVKTQWVTFYAFVNMGILAALAGLIFTARINMAGPKAGVNFELDAIAAAFIGGAAVTGGIGTVVGAIIGGLIMGVMNNGMSILGIGIDYQYAIKGLVLLLAVAFDVYNKKRVGR